MNFPLTFGMSEKLLNLQRQYKKQCTRNHLKKIVDIFKDSDGASILELLSVLRETITEYQDAVIVSYFCKYYKKQIEETVLIDEYKRKYQQSVLNWAEMTKKMHPNTFIRSLEDNIEEENENIKREKSHFVQELKIGLEYLDELRLKIRY